jgi:DMSO/TMAO reductase YedYZ molybdopterin-dependent catalytic subunit
MVGLAIFWLTLYAFITLDIDLFQDPNSVKIKGMGVENEITLSLNELKSDTYLQVTNKQFEIENSVNNKYNRTYTGVSLWSILEVKNILTDDAQFLTFRFIGRDGYVSPLALNLSIAKNNPDRVIIAYEEDGVPLFGDGPLRSVIDQSVMPSGEYASQYSVQQLASVQIN